MAGRPSRRGLIYDAALELAADGGNHAVTHQGIDARLGLAKGSTSYYYRTRRALVTAVIAHLAERSRARFSQVPQLAVPVTVDAAVEVIADQLETLVVERRRDVLARYALIADAAADDELRDALASCFFSVPAATALFDALFDALSDAISVALSDARFDALAPARGQGALDPESAARDLIVLLEGLVFDCTLGPRPAPTEPGPDLETWRGRVRATIRRWVDALVGL